MSDPKTAHAPDVAKLEAKLSLCHHVLEQHEDARSSWSRIEDRYHAKIIEDAARIEKLESELRMADMRIADEGWDNCLLLKENAALKERNEKLEEALRARGDQ